MRFHTPDYLADCNRARIARQPYTPMFAAGCFNKALDGKVVRDLHQMITRDLVKVIGLIDGDNVIFCSDQDRSALVMNNQYVVSVAFVSPLRM